MWQKALVKKCQSADWLVGQEIWTLGKPQQLKGCDAMSLEPIATVDSCLLTNLRGAEGEEIYIDLCVVELLGGPNAFCEDPPLVPHEEWATQPKEAA